MSTQLLARMTVQADDWETRGDRRAVFLSCYALMTRNMYSALSAGRFRSRGWVRALLEHFAEHYSDALSRYEQRDPRTPTVWEFTHVDAARPGPLPVQQLFLGADAHINYDLALTVVDLLGRSWFNLEDSSAPATRGTSTA